MIRVASKPEMTSSLQTKLSSRPGSLASTLKKSIQSTTNLLPKLDLQAAIKMARQKADGDIKIGFDGRKKSITALSTDRNITKKKRKPSCVQINIEDKIIAKGELNLTERAPYMNNLAPSTSE